MPTVGPSDDSALNPGMFISCSFRIVNFIRHNTAAFFSQVQRQNTLLSPRPRIQHLETAVTFHYLYRNRRELSVLVG
jgi:hypothetical protein